MGLRRELPIIDMISSNPPPSIPARLRNSLPLRTPTELMNEAFRPPPSRSAR